MSSLNSHLFAVELIDPIVHKRHEPGRKNGGFCVIFVQNGTRQNQGKQCKISAVRAIACSYKAAQFAFNLRAQRTFRCGFTHARRGSKCKTQPCGASVGGTAAFVSFGFVPAVSPPALHFSARRTADRSVPMNNAVACMANDLNRILVELNLMLIA
jgi:hypothetical protein